MEPREFPFIGAAYSASEVRKAECGSGAGSDEAFEQLLQDCTTVQQVFRRLEVPGEQVRRQVLRLTGTPAGLQATRGPR